jgi:hypothetical protein
MDQEPISKCFAFLKLAFEACLHIQIINYIIINYLKCKLLTKTSLLLFARASQIESLPVYTELSPFLKGNPHSEQNTNPYR